MAVSCLIAALAAPVTLLLGLRGDGTGQSADVVTGSGALSGLLSLESVTPAARLSTEYTPVVRFTAAAPALFQELGAAATTHSGQATFDGRLSSSMGTQDFSPLSRPAVTGPGLSAPPIEALPQQRYLDVLSLQASAAVHYRTSGRLETSATFSGGTSGGLGSAAQAVLPRQNTVGAALAASWQASRVDALGFGVWTSFAQTAQATGAPQRSAVAGAQASLTHRFDAATSGTLGLGLASTFDLRRHTATLAVPAVNAGLSRTVPVRGVTLSLTGGAQPAIDPLQGDPYVQASATAAAGWLISRSVTLTGGLSAARALGGPFSGHWGGAADAGAAVRVNPWLSFNAGLREAAVPRAIRGDTLQWSAFAGFATQLRESL